MLTTQTGLDTTARVNHEASLADRLTAWRTRYLANLQALYLADPLLAARVDSLPFRRLPSLELARDGHPTVRLLADDGQPVYVHSRYRPLEEAQALVETQMRQRPVTPDTDGQDPNAQEEAGEDTKIESECYFVSGLGLGYHLAALERLAYKPLVIVAEDDLALLKAALCVTDLTGPLRERRLTFLTSADKATLHERLRDVMTYVLLGLHFITLPHTRRYHTAFYAELWKLLRDFVGYSRVQIYSLLRHARLTCRNIAYNLPAYLRNPGVEVLKNRARGYPAILVAAGPSLARNVDQLRELRGRAVIIAVQTVFKTLLARGIPPHFVTSLDYHELSAQFFEGIAEFGPTILVAEPKAHWRVLDTYRGRTHVLHSDFVDRLLREVAPPRGALPSGSTVAHLSFYLAEYLGCDPILLVGQDLCFTEGLYYPAGMPIEQIWGPELGRFYTIEMKQWERIVRSRAMLRVVKDIHGRDTYTDEQLYVYAEQFQSDFLASSARVIQASEGGMRMAGTEVLTLREAAQRYCTRPLPDDLFALPTAPPPPDLKDRACAALEARLAELKEMRAIATETADVLERLDKLVERPAEFNRLVARVDELRTRMSRYQTTYELVVSVSQVAELRRLRADRTILDDQEETPESARRRLRRDREYVAAFIDGCDYLEKTLPEALARVREQLP